MCVSARPDVDLWCYEEVVSETDLNMMDVLLNTQPFGEASRSPEWESIIDLWGATPIGSPATSVNMMIDNEGVSDAECCRQLRMQLCCVDLGVRVDASMVHPRKQVHAQKELWGCVSARHQHAAINDVIKSYVLCVYV